MDEIVRAVGVSLVGTLWVMGIVIAAAHDGVGMGVLVFGTGIAMFSLGHFIGSL